MKVTKKLMKLSKSDKNNIKKKKTRQLTEVCTTKQIQMMKKKKNVKKRINEERGIINKTTQTKSIRKNKKAKKKIQCDTKKTKLFHILDFSGTGKDYVCLSIHDLLVQIGQVWDILPYCITLSNNTGEVVHDHDYDKCTLKKNILHATHNTILSEEIPQWSDRVWRDNIIVYLKNNENVRILDALDASTTPNYADHMKGKTIIHLLSQPEPVELVRKLLTHRLDINRKYWGKALWYAAYYGVKDIVDMILEYEKDFTLVKGKFGGRALISACTEGFTDIVIKLISYGVNTEGYGGEALVNSCKEGYIEIAKILIRHGIDLHRFGERALLAARTNTHCECAQYIENILRRENTEESE